MLIVEIDDFPGQAVKLIEKRFLNVVAFVESGLLGCFVLGHKSIFIFLNMIYAKSLYLSSLRFKTPFSPLGSIFIEMRSWKAYDKDVSSTRHRDIG